jgi:hypothetical protein
LLICALLHSRLPGLVCLYVCALFDQSTAGGGASSYQHLSSGEPLWYTTCTLHVLLALCLRFAHLLLSPRSWDIYRRRPTIRHVAWWTPWWAGASMRPLDLGPSPGLGLSPRYLRFSRGVGLETRPSPIHPMPGVNVASLVCDLASLSVWWRHGEWAPFPRCPLARGLWRSLAAPPPPPPPSLCRQLVTRWYPYDPFARP